MLETAVNNAQYSTGAEFAVLPAGAYMGHSDERLRTAYEVQVRGLNETIEKRERELAILARVAARIHGEDDETAILNIALDEILAEMKLQTAWIFMGDESDRKLHLAAHRGVAK